MQCVQQTRESPGAALPQGAKRLKLAEFTTLSILYHLHQLGKQWFVQKVNSKSVLASQFLIWLPPVGFPPYQSILGQAGSLGLSVMVLPANPSPNISLMSYQILLVSRL